jgi:hypothetical protein
MDDVEERARQVVRVQLKIAALTAQDSLGYHHRETASALVAVGREAAADDRFDEAEAALRRAVAILQTQPDADRGAVAAVLRDLGELFLVAGRQTDARHAFRWSLRLYEDAFGPAHPLVVTVRALAER